MKRVTYSSVKMPDYILHWATFKQSTLLLSLPLTRFLTSKMFLRVIKGCFCCSLDNVCSNAEQVDRFQDFLALPSLETRFMIISIHLLTYDLPCFMFNYRYLTTLILGNGICFTDNSNTRR